MLNKHFLISFPIMTIIQFQENHLAGSRRKKGPARKEKDRERARKHKFSRNKDEESLPINKGYVSDIV